MSKARVAVLHVISGQLTVTAAAKTYGFSRQHLHRLLKRYREGYPVRAECGAVSFW
jgi:transposase-like protein